MLKYLENIPLRAACTVFTMDMGYQYEYASRLGYGVSFGNMLSWPLKEIEPIEKEKWDNIIFKINDKNLNEKDFEGTGLKYFLKNMQNYCYEDDELWSLFSSLKEVTYSNNKPLYCMCDFGNQDYPKFYTNKEDLLEDFENIYCNEYYSWDSLDNEELEEWVNNLKDGFGEIECELYSAILND